MNFRRAVERVPDLRGALRPGLKALRAQDRPHVAPEDPRRLRGSVDVDAALRPRHPHAHRWDFAIGYRHSNLNRDFIYWVEMHTATDRQVKVVLEKLSWLKGWLAGDGCELRTPDSEFVWVSSGATTFTLSAPQRKEFAQSGLYHRGQVFRIPLARPR